MTWQIELGEQIRNARTKAGVSQEGLSAKISSIFSYTYTRAQISNIEHGKSAPPVNIISAIAEILSVEFEVRGCRIGKRSESEGRLTVMPQQLSFPFDVEHSFSSATLKLTAMPENSLLLQAVFVRGQQRPQQTIDVAG
jgi:transcriptional regulator with XRE-family HTH domain